MNILLFILLPLLILSCSSDKAETNVAGFGSETTNGITIGITGTDDYSNVIVKSVPYDYNPATDKSTELKEGTINDSGRVYIEVDSGSNIAIYGEDTVSGKKFYISPFSVDSNMSFQAEMTNTGDAEITFKNSAAFLDKANGYVYITGYPEYVALAEELEVTNDSTAIVHFESLPAALLPSLSYAVKEQEEQQQVIADSVPIVSDSTTEFSTRIYIRYLTRYNSPIISDTVTDVLFGPFDGKVWVATDSGLLNYHMGKWDTVDFPLIKDNLVTSICQSSDSVIWFGSLQGISRYANNNWLNFTTETHDFILSDRIGSMVSNTQGTMWIGTDSGLTYYTGDTIMHYDSRFLPDPRVNTLAIDCTGVIWGGTFNGVFRIDTDFVPTHYPPSDDYEKLVLDIHITKDNRVVVCSNSGAGFLDRETGKLEWITSQVPIASAEEDSEGNIWLANYTYGRLMKYANTGILYSLLLNDTYYLPGRPIKKIAIDEQDNVYCGTAGYGLFIIGPTAHTLFYEEKEKAE